MESGKGCKEVSWSNKDRRLRSRLCGLLLEEGDEVVAVLGLLETTKGHLGAGNVLLGVLEVVELQPWLAVSFLRAAGGPSWRRSARTGPTETYHGVLVPRDTLLLVGVGVGVAVDLTRLAAKDTVEGRADLVALTSLEGVALSAAGLPERVRSVPENVGGEAPESGSVAQHSSIP